MKTKLRAVPMMCTGAAMRGGKSPITARLPRIGELLLASLLWTALGASCGFASTITGKSRSAGESAGKFTAWLAVNQPSSPDSWNGGTGQWSAPGNWSTGLPGSSSDVNINSGGSDFVNFDTNASINSLTIGGTTGTSIVQGYNNIAQTLNIAGALTVNATGEFIPTMGDVVNAATLVNQGVVYIAGGATLNLTNQPSGLVDIGQNSFVGVLGTFNAGGQNALRNLTSVEGELSLQDHKTTNITPVGGTFTVSSTGDVDVSGAMLHIAGDLNNFGTTSAGINGGGANELDITGTLTNNPGATVRLYSAGNTIANVGQLVNNGLISVGFSQTLNLTNQPAGLTDVVAGSEFDLYGNFTAGSNGGFGKLQSVEGRMIVENALVTTATPGNGSLAIAAGGYVELDGVSRSGTTLQVNGDLNNSGWFNGNGGGSLTVTGTLTNNNRFGVEGNGIPELNRVQALTSFVNNANGNVNLLYDGSLSTPTLVNSGRIAADHQSGISVGPVGGTPLPGYFQAASGKLGEVIASTGIYGQMSVDGPASLNGILQIDLAPGFNPQVGATYKFLTFAPGELTGTFSGVEDDYFNNNTEQWFVDYDNAGGFVELIAESASGSTPEPSSLALFGSGILGVAWVLRRRSRP